MMAYEFMELKRQLYWLILIRAKSAKADIAVMASRAKGEDPKFWRGLSLA